MKQEKLTDIIIIDTFAIINTFIMALTAYVRCFVLLNSFDNIYYPISCLSLFIEAIYMMVAFPFRISRLFRNEYNLYWIFITIRLIFYSLFIASIGHGDLW